MYDRVHAVDEAEHVALVANGEVKCFAVLEDEGDAAPGIPDVLFLIWISLLVFCCIFGSLLKRLCSPQELPMLL